MLMIHRTGFLDLLVHGAGGITLGSLAGAAAWTVWSYGWDWYRAWERRRDQRDTDRQIVEYEIALSRQKETA